MVFLSLCEQKGPEHTAKVGCGIKSVQTVWGLLVKKSISRWREWYQRREGLVSPSVSEGDCFER